MNLQLWQHFLAQRDREKGGTFLSHNSESCRQIFDGITNGVPIDFNGDRTVDREGPNLKIDPDHVAKVTAVINADVATLKKAGPFARKPFEVMAVSPIGAIPKKQPGKIRVIHHLSFPFKGDSVNEGIAEVKMNIANFGWAARAVVKLGRGCFLIKLDVEAAYKQVPVRREDWHLLGFKWLDQWYYERVLPFGLRSSCRLWELYANALHWMFENVLKIHRDRFVIHYVDDFLFVVKLKDDAVAMRDQALALCKMLGIPMAEDKTEGPVHKLTFLGIELDTLEMCARLPSTKLQELQTTLREWGEKSHASARELQSLAGKLNFACAVVRPGRAFLQRIIDHAARTEQNAPSPVIRWPLTAAVMEDVAWWAAFLPRWNGHSLLYEQEWIEADKLELFTDACGHGFGARFGNDWLCGAWSPDELAHAKRKNSISMPFLELLALTIAAASWGERWTTRKVIFRSDCIAVVHCINKRQSDQPEMAHLIREFVTIACLKGFDFRAVHIPGVQNVCADLLSRDGASAVLTPQYRALCPNPSLHATPSIRVDLLPTPPSSSIQPPSDSPRAPLLRPRGARTRAQ